MESNDVLEKIKSKGYWEINIHPSDHKDDLIPKEKAEEYLKGSQVELRGWDYPHFSYNDKPLRFLKGIELYTSWEMHIEFWRLTYSGNFYHLLALREDWIEPGRYNNLWSNEDLTGQKLLGSLNTLYTLTEIYEFAKRFGGKLGTKEIVIDLKLHDLNNRRLIVDSQGRIPFYPDKISNLREPWSNRVKEVSLQELIENSGKLAIEEYKDLVYYFKWDNVPSGLLENDQKKFLEGKI